MATKAKKAAAKPVENDDAAEDNGYDELLNRTYGALPKVKDIPEGTYGLKVRNAVYMKATDKVSPKLLVFVTLLEPKLVSADGDVDDDLWDALNEEAGGEYDLSVNEASAQFWLGEAKDWKQVDDLIAVLGIDPEELTDVKMGDIFKMFKGRSAVGYVKYDTYTSNGQTKRSLKVTAFSAEED